MNPWGICPKYEICIWGILGNCLQCAALKWPVSHLRHISVRLCNYTNSPLYFIFRGLGLGFRTAGDTPALHAWIATISGVETQAKVWWFFCPLQDAAKFCFPWFDPRENTPKHVKPGLVCRAFSWSSISSSTSARLGPPFSLLSEALEHRVHGLETNESQASSPASSLNHGHQDLRATS